MRRVFGAVVVLVLSFSVPAAAEQPPNSAIDQYRQSIPNGRGNQPVDQTGGGGGTPRNPGGHSGASGGPSSGSYPSSGAQASGVQATHHDGNGVNRKAAALAASTDPDSQTGHGISGGDLNSAGGTGGSRFGDTLSHALSGGDTGGMGIAFPLILASSLLAALFVLFKRRRGGGQQAH